MLQDIRFAVRHFRRRPLWSATIILVLALGIGGNTAMFSGFEAWVTRPLDFAHPEDLVDINAIQPEKSQRRTAINPVNLGDLIAAQQSFDGMGAFYRRKFNLSDDDFPVRIDGARVTAGLFPMLGKHPVLGRNFREEEDLPDAPGPVVLISDRLWRTRFDTDPGVLGKKVRLDGMTHEIIGVMEPGFQFPEWGDVWAPAGLDVHHTDRANRFIQVHARLRPGTSLDSANQDLNSIGARLSAQYPGPNEGWSFAAIPLRDSMVPDVIKVAMWASLAAAIFVLLVICANVASLMLMRASARAGETALRSALGASRFRLLRQSVLEGVLLALPAGVLGIIISLFCLDSMLAAVPVDPPYLFAMGFTPVAGLYTLAASLLAGVACGLAPVLRSSGIRPVQVLRSGVDRVSGTVATRRLRGALVVAELALSTALLIGALLMVKSFIQLQNTDPGYRVDNIVAAELSLTGEGLEEGEERVLQIEGLRAALEDLAAVESVGMASQLPASPGNRIWELVPEGADFRRGDKVDAIAVSVAGDYLSTLEIPILSGRSFTPGEKRVGGHVAIVSRRLSQRLWGDGEAVGRRLRPYSQEGNWFTVVGVVGDVDFGRDLVRDSLPDRQIYLPYGEVPTSTVSIAMRSPTRPARLAGDLQEVLLSAAPGVPVSDLITMDQAILRVRWVSRFFSAQLAIYAALATAIAALGLYGLTADSVAGRTRELAIRTALGANRGNLVRLLLQQSLIWALVGIGFGLGLALLGTRFGASMLIQVGAHDPLIFGSVAGGLGLVTVLAAFLPALRATQLDPAGTLRSQ